MQQKTLIDEPDTKIRKFASMSSCGNYRWTLARRWGIGDRIACWVMLNPSTADHKVDDPTIKRVIHFTRSWGYDGFDVVNLFPYRSSSPKECRDYFAGVWEGPDWDIRDDLQENLRIVLKAAKARQLVVAAWGNIGWPQGHGWSEHILEEIRTGADPWPQVWCLGKTQSGQPKHPLARGVHRVPNDQKPVLFAG